MKVFIVTADNGRVHSVHDSEDAAEKERARAAFADEIWGSGVEEHDVREHTLCVGDKARISSKVHLWHGSVGLVCGLPSERVELLVNGCAVVLPRGDVEWVP